MIDATILDMAIAEITIAGKKAPARSKESAAAALVELLKAERELNPPTAEDLAQIAYEQGITPDDFAKAILKRDVD